MPAPHPLPGRVQALKLERVPLHSQPGCCPVPAPAFTQRARMKRAATTSLFYRHPNPRPGRCSALGTAVERMERTLPWGPTEGRGALGCGVRDSCGSVGSSKSLNQSRSRVPLLVRDGSSCWCSHPSAGDGSWAAMPMCPAARRECKSSRNSCEDTWGALMACKKGCRLDLKTQHGLGNLPSSWNSDC